MNKEELMNLPKEKLIKMIISIQDILNVNKTIEIGDMVKSINGTCYAYYATWDKLKQYKQNFVKGKSPQKDYIYKVIELGKHSDNCNENLALIQDQDTTQVFITNINTLIKE